MSSISDCSEDASKCCICRYSFGEVMEDGQKTGICGKCPEYCEECDDDHSICIKCEDGAGFILDEKRKKNRQMFIMLVKKL